MEWQLKEVAVLETGILGEGTQVSLCAEKKDPGKRKRVKMCTGGWAWGGGALTNHVLKEIEGLCSASRLKNLSSIRNTDTSSSGWKNKEGHCL